MQLTIRPPLLPRTITTLDQARINQYNFKHRHHPHSIILSCTIRFIQTKPPQHRPRISLTSLIQVSGASIFHSTWHRLVAVALFFLMTDLIIQTLFLPLRFRVLPFLRRALVALKQHTVFFLIWHKITRYCQLLSLSYFGSERRLSITAR